MQQETFPNWTEYDTWLVEHYGDYSMCSVNEVDGKILVEYCDKSELEKINEEFKKSHPEA